MIKDAILIIICIVLACGCYTNYQGWERCQKTNDYLGDEIYKAQKKSKADYSDYFRAKLDARCGEVKIAELEAKIKELRAKK